MKTSSKVALALLAGLLAGTFAFRPRAVKAQEAGSVHVYVLTMQVDSDNATRSMNVPGARVAGMSCVPNPQPKLPKAVTCYVATTLN